MSKKTKKKGKPQTPEARARARALHFQRKNPPVPVSIRVPPKGVDSGLIAEAAFQNLMECQATAEDFGEVQTFCRFYRLLAGLFVIEQHCPQEQLQVISRVIIDADRALERVIARYEATGKFGVNGEDRLAFDALLGLAPEMDRVGTRRQGDAIMDHILYDAPLPHTKRTAVGLVIDHPRAAAQEARHV